jgi:hypothetical protein
LFVGGVVVFGVATLLLVEGTFFLPFSGIEFEILGARVMYNAY